MEKNKTPIIVISGVGGAGKNSVLEVFKNYPDKFAFYVSYTDRAQREDDVPGESYHFISQDDFSKALKNDEFLEWEKVRGEFRYGRKKGDLEKIIASGKVPVMNIEVKGAEKFKKIHPIISFFILPPSKEEAERRMRARGTDSEDAIQHRVERYDLELSYKDKYDYIIVNDDLRKAQDEVIKIALSRTTAIN
jgi:guanylate kinase